MPPVRLHSFLSFVRTFSVILMCVPSSSERFYACTMPPTDKLALLVRPTRNRQASQITQLETSRKLVHAIVVTECCAITS